MSINEQALEEAIGAAPTIARCYTALAEALVREGVPEQTARSEARLMAIMVGMMIKDGPGGWEP